MLFDPLALLRGTNIADLAAINVVSPSISDQVLFLRLIAVLFSRRC